LFCFTSCGFQANLCELYFYRSIKKDWEDALSPDLALRVNLNLSVANPIRHPTPTNASVQTNLLLLAAAAFN
jgi:hypothetical protein